MTETIAVRRDGSRPRSGRSGAVAVLGSGRVAAALLARGDDRVPFIGPGAAFGFHGEDPSLIVAVACGTGTAALRVAQEHASVRRVPWLPVHIDGGWITVGPLARPSRPGCPLCVRRRQHRNRADAAARRLLRERETPEPGGDAMVPPALAAVVARLVRGEAEAALAGTGGARTDGAVLRLSVLDGSVRRHRFLPDPSCPRCADLPPDDRAAAMPERRPLPKPDPGVFRLADLGGREAELLDLYVDPETGVIGSVDAWSYAGVPTAVARLTPGHVHSDAQHGYGRGADYRSARLTALAEALERGAGEHPGGRRTVVRAPYEEVAGDAIDPRTLGTPPEESYRLPGHPFVPFAPDQPANWVWGYSFARSAPVLVPESVAYYGGTGPWWVFETSNGCAAGSCLAEAILYGLLEVAERDAFLLTWYARLPVPRVDLDSAADRRIPMAEELLARRFGYEVMVFSTMLEQRVPTFLTLAVNRTGEDRPAMAFGAAAHLDPERAVLSALWETVTLVAGLGARFDPRAVEPMLGDPLLVREMEDHAALYTHPATRSRVPFLTGGGPRLPLRAVAGRAAWPRHRDLSDDLRELVGRYLATGLDVIAVDTTSTEQAAGGFASAKVIVPGTVPMTFGHAFRRTENLPRLLTVPRLLGYRDRDLRPEEINPHPHPFP